MDAGSLRRRDGLQQRVLSAVGTSDEFVVVHSLQGHLGGIVRLSDARSGLHIPADKCEELDLQLRVAKVECEPAAGDHQGDRFL